MNHQEYNGYYNFESWNVALWIDNDQGLQGDVNDMAQNSTSIYDLETTLKDYIEELKPEVEGMWADLLNAALSEVNWRELAENYYNEAHEEAQD
jgi:hypothetical protein